MERVATQHSIPGMEYESARVACILQGKRRVGRPIAYQGDPDAPHLTPAERRRIKRRVANRESARRVRARQFLQVSAMADKVMILNLNLNLNLI